MVRMKFLCVDKTQRANAAEGGFLYEVRLTAVNREASPALEDEVFGKWTPSGELRATIKGEAAAAYFIPGRHYYLDATEASALAEVA